MSTIKKATVMGNAKRISELEEELAESANRILGFKEELADLKAQMMEVATPTPVVAPSAPTPSIAAPPPSPSYDDKSIIKYLHDMELLRTGKIRPSNFKKRYANFVETGKL
jgi:hypothetical protein